MKCNQLKNVESFLKGELDEKDAATLQVHLAHCNACSDYYAELIYKEKLLPKLKGFKPTLENPADFRSEILGKIQSGKRLNLSYRLSSLIDNLIFIIVKPVTKYSFMTAALVIFGVFIYQQAIIVGKIDSLEKRREYNVKSEVQSMTSRKNVEALLKKRSGIKSLDKEFNELLEDYSSLQIKHRILLRILKEKYPDTHRDIVKEMEAVQLLPEDLNI